MIKRLLAEKCHWRKVARGALAQHTVSLAVPRAGGAGRLVGQAGIAAVAAARAEKGLLQRGAAAGGSGEGASHLACLAGRAVAAQGRAAEPREVARRGRGW